MLSRTRFLGGLILTTMVAVLAGCETGPQTKQDLTAKTTITAVKPPQQKAPALPKGASVISTEEVKALVAKGPKAGNYLMFDSRPATRFHAGTIPTSLMLPSAEMEKFDKEGKVHPLLGSYKNKLLIFWCGGPTCPFSIKGGELALKYGYTNVRIYSAGDPAWAKAEQPFESSASFVKDSNILLIDLRTTQEFATAHIPRAINLPAAKLESYQEEHWPAFKGAAIVFYSNKQADIDKALELMKDYGLSKATYFSGGVERWQQLGNAVKSGPNPAPAKLVFIRKLNQQDIPLASIDKFINDPNIVILDVRGEAERATGSFKGSLHIPFEQIATRYTEIPKDKIVVVHCATGIRSSITYETLKAKGFSNVKVINANVKFVNGVHKITE